MKNQNNIIIFLAFLIILLLIPTVCASDLNNTDDSVALSSSNAIISVDLQNNASAILGTTDSPLSSSNSDKSTGGDDSSSVPKSGNEILSANSAGTFTELQKLISGTSQGDTLVLDSDYNNTDKVNGITINRGMTIDGNGYTIDASNFSRIFQTPTNGTIEGLTLKNIVFKNGKSTGNNVGGGAIRFDTIMKGLVIENCTFMDCYSSAHGSAIYFSKDVTDSNMSAKFIGNKAGNQGTVYTSKTKVAPNYKFDNCNVNFTFINNTAMQTPGAKFFSDVSNSVFNFYMADNVAYKYSGGSYFDQWSRNVNITGTFVNNIAGASGDGSGGALYFRYVENVNVEGTFIGNKALTRYSGAIHLENSVNGMNINGYFENNSANFEGGAIYVKGPAQDLHINGTFINNVAKGIGGGAIEMTSNVKNSTIDGTFIGNSANNGSAIRIGGKSINNKINGVFTDNSGTLGTIYLNDCQGTEISGDFSGNTAEYGGAVYSTASGISTASSTFDGNKAINGSAIYLDDSTLNASTTTFGDNQAYSYRLPIVYNGTSVGAILYGGDNILNAIYNNGNSSNVIIDGVSVVDGAERSQGGTIDYQDLREYNQVINLTIYDVRQDSFTKSAGLTDIYGKYTIPYEFKDEYCYIVYANHPENDMYKAIDNDTAIRMDAGLNLLNHTMYEGNVSGQKLISALFDDKLTGISNATTINYYILLNGVYKFLGSSDTNYMGVSSIMESSVFKTLKAGNYTLFANYTNDDGKYVKCDTTANLEVLPLYYHVTKTLVNTEDIHLDDNVYFNITFYNDGDCEITKLYAWDEYPTGIKFLVNDTFPGWHIEEGMWVLDTPFPAHTNMSLILPFKAVQIGNFTNRLVMYANSLAFSNSSEIDFSILPSPNMAVAKSLETKGTIYDNTQVVFEVNIKNTGDVDLKNAYLIDYENINGLIFDHYYSDSNCWILTRMGDGTIKFTLNHTLAINETHGIELYYNATKSGNFTNNASALCEYPEVNVTASADVEVIPYLPDLTIEKVDRTADTKYVGDQIVYHISVENTGNAILDNVYFIEDAYTEGLVYDHFVSIQGNWSETKLDSKRYKFTLNSKAEIGFEYSAYLYFNLTSPGFKNNTVITGFNNTIDVNDTTCGVNVLPFLANVTIEKDRVSNWEVLPDSLVRFTVEVTNTGNADLKNFYFVEDDYSDGLVYVTSNRNQSWTVSTVGGKYLFRLNHVFKMKETVLIEVVFNATTLGNKTNKVVAYFSNSSDLSNPEVLGEASDWVYVNETVSPYPEGTNYNITLEKRLITHGDIYVGDTVGYEIVAHNVGNVTITDLVLVDNIHPKLKYSYWDNSSYWIVTQEGNKLTLRYNNSIPLRDYAVVSLYFKAVKDGNISNTAIASWNVGRNSTEYTTPDKEVLPYNPNVHVTKVVNTTHAYVGDNVTYEIIVKNTGNTPIKYLSFDESDLGILKFNDYYSHDEWIYNKTANSFTFNRPLGLNESTVIALYYTVTGEGSVVNNVTVLFNENTTDASSKNLTTEFKKPQMTVKKVALKGVTVVGEQIIFEVVIHNTGNVDLNDVFILDDNYTRGLVYDSHRGDIRWDYDASTHRFTSARPLLKGENATLHIIFNATERGIQTNNASAGANNTVMGSDVASVRVLAKDPEITLEKITLTNNTNIGEDILFQISIKNVGDYDLRNLTLLENYTAGLKYVGMVGSIAWTHSVVSGSDVFKYVRVLTMGESLNLTLKFTSEFGGLFDNTATAFEGDFNLADASNSTFVRHDSIVNPTDVSVIYTQDINVPINVTDERGNLLTDGTATLVIEGNTYTVNIRKGIATFKNVRVSKPGVYKGTIEYSGYGVYNPSGNNVTVTVAKLNTTTVSKNITERVETRFVIDANITDQFNRPVQNGTAKLLINGEVHYAIVNKGTVRFDNFDNPQPGNFYADIIYESNDYYETSNTTIHIFIDKLLTTVSGEDTFTKPGMPVDFVIDVEDEFGNPVQNGTVTFVFENYNLTLNVTNGNVVFEGLIAPMPGNYTANIYYKDDDYYYPSNSTIKVFVSKLITFMDDVNIVAYKDDVIDITTRVYDEFGDPVIGNVSVVINGKLYDAEIINSFATFEDVSLTQVGNFTQSMVFEETDDYLPTNATLNIKVLPLEFHVTKVLMNDTVHLGDVIYFNITFYNDCNHTFGLIYADDLYSDGIELYTDKPYPGWTLINDYAVYNSPLPAYSSTSVLLPFKTVKLGNWSNDIVMYVNGFDYKNRTSVNFTVLPSPNMTISKVLMNKDVIYEGNQVIFKIEIINTGDVNLENAFFVDYKTVGGLVYDHFEYNEDCWNVEDLGDKVKFILNHAFAIGESHVIELVYNATYEGNFTNNATVGCEYEEAIDSSAANVEVLPYNPFVEVTKVLVSNVDVYVGDQVAYHITVKNTGDVGLDNIYFIEDDYGDLVFDHFKETPENWIVEKLGGNRYKFTLNQKVQPGEKFGLTLYFNTTTAGFKNNTVIAGFNDEQVSSNTTCGVEVLPRNVAIQLEKIKAETDRVITVGELAKFRVVIINKGNIALDNVYFIEDIPEGLVYLYSQQNASWTVSKISDNRYKFTYGKTLPPEDMANILLVFNTTSMGIKNNTVFAGYDDFELANASDYVNVTNKHVPDVEGDNSNITVEKYLLTPGTIYVGDQVVYEIRVHNVGDKHLESAELILNELPCENLVYAGWDSASSWSVDEESLTFTLNRIINVGGYAALHVYFNVTGSGNITNTVNAIWNNGKNHTSITSDEKKVLPYEPNITATKVLVKDMAFIGDQVIYEVIIKNTGNVPLDSIFFIEKEWGDVLVFDHYTTDDDWVFNETSNTFRLVRSLTNDDVSTVLLYFNATSEGSVANSIEAGFNGNKVTNATSKNVTVVEKTINMTAVKISLDPNGVTVGNQVRFEFKITNTGTMDLYNVFIREDNFSEGLVYDSIRSDVPWTYDESTKTFILDKLEAGDYTTVHLIFNTTSRGIKTNNATYGYNDTVMGNAVANVVVFDEKPEVSVEKITLTNNTNIGEDVLFKVNITNVGDYNIRNLTVVEDYASGLELVSVEGAEDWTQTKDAQGRDVFTYNRVLRLGQSVALIFKFKSTEGGILNNTVDVFANDIKLANATNSTNVMHNTNITAVPVEGKVGDKVNVTAVIVDENGNLVPNGTAALVIGGVEYAADVTGGVAVFEDVILPAPGVYEGNVSYSGSDYYNPSNNTVDVVVSPLDTNITVEPVEGKVGDKVNVTVDVIDENGNPVLDGTAALVIGGVVYTADVIDGVAVFEDVILPAPGSYECEITYNGSEKYNSSSTTVDIDVSALDTSIVAEPIEGKVGEKVSVTANVTDENGNPVPNGTATLSINGVEYTADILNGVVTFEGVVLPNTGNYTGQITYPGDKSYNPSETTIGVIVSKLDTTIEADDIIGYPSDIVDIVATVLDENGNPVLSGVAVLQVSDKIANLDKSAAGEYSAYVVNGKAVFKNVVLSTPGIYEGYLAYLGDATYNPSNNTMKITVLKVPVDISAEATSGKPGETVNVTVKVTPRDGTEFNGVVTVNLPDGTTRQVTITNGVGVTQWTIPDDFKEGKYEILVMFDGDDYYAAGNASAFVEVLKDNKTIPTDNETTPESKVIQQTLAKHETGNPILALLVILSIIGLIPLKRK